MIRNVLVFLALIGFINVSLISNAQDRSWPVGDWLGTLYNQESSNTSDFITTLQISNVSKNVYDGIRLTAYREDPSVRISRAIRGVVYDSYLKYITTEVLSVVDPSNGRWERECHLCDSVILNLSIDSNSLIISGVANCSSRPLCSGIVRYTRKLSDFDSSSNASLNRFILQSHKEVLIANWKKYNQGKVTIEANYADSSQNTSIKPAEPQLKDAIVQRPRPYRKLETLKTITVDTDSIELVLYDNGTIDNDSITVIQNGKVIVNKLRLTDKPYSKIIRVERDVQNQIIFFAENLGTIPPNTALIKIVHEGKVEELITISDYIKSATVIIEQKRKKVTDL